MRRKEREVTDLKQILAIIESCDVCRIAFFDEGYPYIVPLNFGYKEIDGSISLYFHCANVGKKIDLLKKNNHVSFEMDCAHNLVNADKTCETTMEFESICGNGELEILDKKSNIEALTVVMQHYKYQESYNFDASANKITTLKLIINQITAKKLKQK